MASTVYAELKSILTNLCGIYDQLFDILQSEREALIGHNFDELSELNQEKEMLCSQVHRLESDREALFEDLRVQFQILENPLKIKSLLPVLPQDWKDDILEQSERLQDVVDLCRERFESNKALIEACQENMNSLKDHYQNTLQATSSTYSKEGKVATTAISMIRKKL